MVPDGFLGLAATLHVRMGAAQMARHVPTLCIFCSLPVSRKPGCAPRPPPLGDLNAAERTFSSAFQKFSKIFSATPSRSSSRPCTLNPYQDLNP